MKRRAVLSLTGIGLATLTTGCIGTESVGTRSDETTEQDPSSENADGEQDAEDEGPIFSSDDGSEAEQQQEQEQNSEGEDAPEPEAEDENNTEQHDEPDQQDGADESTDDESPPEIADLRVFVEHKELRETIPGATVIIRHQDDESAQWQKTTSTDSRVDGTFATFRAIPMGLYEVIVRADGFVESTAGVEVSKKELDVTFQLTPAESTVLFIVEDQYVEPHKSPVPGAEIDISYGVSETATVTTDEQGEARFTAPQSGEYTYSVRADGYQTPTEKRTVTVEDDTTVEISLRYPVHTLTVDAGEKNAEVELVRLRDKQTDEKTSGIDGKVYFEVYPGDYKVSAYLGSEVVTVPETTSVSLAD